MLHEPWAGIDSVAFCRDGETVITASDGNDEQWFWDAATGQPTHDIPEPYSLDSVRVAISAEAKIILAFSNVFRLQGSSTGQRIDPRIEAKGPVLSAALSPDGERIATGFADGTTRLWDAATGQPLGTAFLHQELVRSVAFSCDGKEIVTLGPRMITVWDCATGRPVGQHIVHRDRDHSVAISPDGRTILAGISDHGARLWDAATGQPIGPTPESDGVLVSRVFSPDGKTIATTSFVDSAAKRRAKGITRLWHLPPLVVDDLPRI
jgi:WD40 repeat protein